MAVTMQQISPVAHLPLVLGVLRKLKVATLIDTFCPPHPAPVLSCGRGVEALLLAILDGPHALYKVGARLEERGRYPCSSPASREPLFMITGWGSSSMPCLPPISTACLVRSRSTPWRCMPSRPPGSSRIRPRSLCMGLMRKKRAKSPRASQRQSGQSHRGPLMGTARMGVMISSKCCSVSAGVVMDSRSAWGCAMAIRVTAPRPQWLLIGFALAHAEQTSLNDLEAVRLQVREQEEQPVFRRREGAVFVDGKLAGGAGFPIEAPRRHMGVERSLEGRKRGAETRRASSWSNPGTLWGETVHRQTVDGPWVVPLFMGGTVYHKS
jgi:Domain of unknown function (DUF4277)